MQDVYRLMEQERYGEVRKVCRDLLQGDPGHVEALYLLAMSFFNDDNAEEAALHLRRALLIAPQEPVLYMRYGVTLNALGKTESAIEALRRAVSLDGEFAQAHVNLAQLLWKNDGDSQEVLSLYDIAIDVQPDYALAYVGRGDVLWRNNKPHEAKAAYDKALSLDSNLNGVKFKRATLLPVLPHSWDEIEHWRDTLVQEISALEVAPPPLKDPLLEVGRTLFYVTYHGLNDREIQVRLANLYASACPTLLYKSPHCGRPFHGGKIKLGFVSTNLGSHTIGDLNRALIAALPRESFHIVVFPVGPQKDVSLALIESCADEMIPIPAQITEMQRLIAETELDILHFPDIGMSPETYFLGFARLAPVQCVTWGHPETTGLPEMDYFLSMEDAECTEADDHYSETLIRMPTTVKVPSPPPLNMDLNRSDLGLDEDCHLYSCLQSTFKIHPDFDVMLAGILRRDPLAVILLLGGNGTFWQDELMARFRKTMGDDCQRIQFMDRIANDRFVALLRLSDVLLDPPHFGGGKTTLEALWAGTPVVALPSKFARGRLTRAYYHQMGYTECLVDDPEAYIEKAVRLGTDQEYTQTVRAAIKEKRDILFDNDMAVEAHVRFFKDALKAI